MTQGDKQMLRLSHPTGFGHVLKGTKLPHPALLFCRWEKVEERLFTLSKTSSVTRRPPAHCSSPEIAFAERCSDLDLNLDGAIARQPSVAEADPFLSFSSEDLAGMDKEVEDILSGEESDSEGEQENCWKREVANDSSSGESMSGDHPRGYKRGREGDDDDEDERGIKDGRKGENSDCEGGSEESGEEGEDLGGEEWGEMGAELERELGN